MRGDGEPLVDFNRPISPRLQARVSDMDLCTRPRAGAGLPRTSRTGPREPSAPPATQHLETHLTRLSLNELGAVVGGLLRMKPRTPEADATIRALSIYLEGQRERVGHDELRRRGLPRGSGGVESANKLICHVRLKRSGAWRLEANGNARCDSRSASMGQWPRSTSGTSLKKWSRY